MRCLPLLVMLVALALLVESLRPSAESPADGVQTAFHVEPYLQLPAPDAMTVMWETAHPAIGKVEYGPTPALGWVAQEPKPNRLHQVRIEGLEAGTPYHYRVRCGDLVSKVNVFRTAPPPGTRRWRMAVYGDSRSFPWMHRRVAEQVARANVDLVVHTGDIVANGKNYDSWRKEFFGPISCYAGSVPWVSTIGNHEADSENYFSYMALPGNERHFGFDYANAHIICLDSNGWMEKEGRDVKQRQWMEEHLPKPRRATWTFVAFHHPLFSAHDGTLGRPPRPINRLRWVWAPLFLDPRNRVDVVLTGHDHFYARNYPLTRLSDDALHPVLFLTSAGGGAALYNVKKRDYVAECRMAHHFTLLEFEGDEIQLSAIDIAGRVIDRHLLKKNSTPADWCAFEVEELKNALRKALALADPVVASRGQVTRIDTVLEVPARENPFPIKVSGRARWTATPGWELPDETAFEMRPGEPVRIPLRAHVTPVGLTGTPMLTLEFEPRFRNNRVDLYPIKLTGSPALVPVAASGVKIDGDQDEAIWRAVPAQPLLPATRGDKLLPLGEVRFARSEQILLVAARLPDPDRKLKVLAGSLRDGAKSVLSGEHVRLELVDENRLYSIALSPDQIRYFTRDAKPESLNWASAVAVGDGCWCAEFAVPLSALSNPAGLRVNVVYRNQEARREYELRPSFALGQNPDLIPDWLVPDRKDATLTANFARIKWE